MLRDHYILDTATLSQRDVTIAYASSTATVVDECKAGAIAERVYFPEMLELTVRLAHARRLVFDPPLDAPLGLPAPDLASATLVVRVTLIMQMVSAYSRTHLSYAYHVLSNGKDGGCGIVAFLTYTLIY